MDLTKDPIFKSIMFALFVGYIALVSQSVFAKKPEASKLSTAVVVDANGVVIGDASDISTPVNNVSSVYFQIENVLYYGQLLHLGGVTTFRGAFLYDGPGCTGNAYIDKEEGLGIELLQLRGDMLYSSAGQNPQLVPIYSTLHVLRDGERCGDFGTPSTKEVYPAVETVDVSGYAKPYTIKLIPAP